MALHGWRKRLNDLIVQSQLSRRAVALKAGLGQTYLRDILDRDREPGAEPLQKIADVLGVTVDFILVGPENGTNGGFSINRAKPDNRIFVVGNVGAGVWVSTDFAQDVDEHPVSTFPPDPRYPVAAQFDLVVQGTSLNRIAPDGFLVRCVDLMRAEIEPRDGQAVIVRRLGNGGHIVETTVKRFVQGKGRVELHPDSTDPRWQEPVQYVDESTTEVEITALVLFAYRPIDRMP